MNESTARTMGKKPPLFLNPYRMQVRNYIIQLADTSHYFVPRNEGEQCLKQWADGKPVVVRGRGFAHHMISVIRPCHRDEDQEAQDEVEQEQRKAVRASAKFTPVGTGLETKYLMESSHLPDVIR